MTACECSSPSDMYRLKESTAAASSHSTSRIVANTCLLLFFFFSSRRRHTRLQGDWSSNVCSSDLPRPGRLCRLCRLCRRRRQPSHVQATFQVGMSCCSACPALMHVVSIECQRTEIGRASCRGRV